MNNIRKILLPVGVVAVTATIVTLMHVFKPEPEQSEEGPRPLTVFAEAVQEQPLTLKIETNGEVRARTEVDVVAQVSGQVVSVSGEFTEGGRFNAGDRLLQIDDTDYRYALVSARAEVARQEVQVEQIKADAEVARIQLEGRNASALGLKQPQLAEARAMLSAAEANLEQAELNLRRTRVSVPFNGRVREKLVDVGQFVTVGTPLATVFSTDVAEIRLPLTDAQLASLGLPIGYVAPPRGGPAVMLSAVVAGKQRHWQGNLVRIDAAFDSSTRMLYAVTEVQDPYGLAAEAAGGMPLAVGLYVAAEITGQELGNARVVPRSALRSGNKVFIVNDGLLDIREVQVRHANSQIAVIGEGVRPGDLIVTSPVRDPIHGMRMQAIQQESEIHREAIADLEDKGQ